MKLRSLFSTRPSQLILAGYLSSMGCVSPPSPQEVLDTGFRTPEMTLHTLQMGVRADLPGLEYSCLAAGFRARHGLSQLGYREFRERVLEGEIAFWLGIPDARVTESLRLSPTRHLLRCISHCETFEVELVLEEYWQLWADGELIADVALEPGSFDEWTSVYEDGGNHYVFGQVQLPSELAQIPPEELDSKMSEFRLGREWKIDDLRAGEVLTDP
jgi:hypothetical protein